MSLRKRSNVILLVIFHMLMLVFALPGCKEGTQNSPVSALLIDDAKQATINLQDLGEDVAKHTISGTVVAKNSQEKLANITVTLYFENKLAATTRTTSEGKFFFTRLPSGLYDLKVGADSSLYEETAYVIRVLDDGKMSPTDPVVELTAKASGGEILVKISGLVLSSNNDKLDNIDVEIWRDTNLIKSTVTSGEGRFFFDSLPAGYYRLEVGKSSPVYAAKNFNVSILSDGSVSPTSPSIVLTERAKESFTITGTVETQSNELLSNLKIDLRKDSSASSIIETTYTTGEGKFFFQNLSSGMYYLKVSEGNTTHSSDFYPVRVLSNGTISPASAKILVAQKDLLSVFPVSGKITDAFSGGPIEYATVKIAGFGNILTDKNGHFSFAALLPGLYQIEISKNGFETLVISFNLKTNGQTSPEKLDFQLIHSLRSGYGSIAGRLVDETTNEGIPNLVVRLYKYVKVSKDSLGKAESDWEFSTSLVLTTRTLDYDPSQPQNLKGSFKLTHIGPTTDDTRYGLYFGDGNSMPTFIMLPRDNSNYTWRAIDSLAAGWRFAVGNITVESEKTTFYTNYEHEK